MLTAKYHSTCVECQRSVVPGEAVTYTPSDGLVHMVCPDEPGHRNAPGGASDASKSIMGLSAVDADGNVLAVMTPRGWQEPIDAKPVEEREYKSVDLDRHLRAGKSTAELLANAEERVALYRDDPVF